MRKLEQEKNERKKKRDDKTVKKKVVALNKEENINDCEFGCHVITSYDGEHFPGVF